MLNLKLDGLDEATATALKSEAAQTLITEAHEAALAEALTSATRAKDAVLGEKKALQTKLDEYDALGGLEALKAVPELDKTVKTKTTAEATYAEQVKELQKQLNELKHQSINEKLNTKLYKEIKDADGVPELLETHVKARLTHSLDAAGNLKVTVLDKNGVELFVDGKEACVKDLLTEFKQHPTLARAFNAPALNGAGTKQSNGGGKLNPFATATKNLSEQGRLIRTDRQEAIRLANAAGVRLTGLNS